ncbi:MAG: hypothetical protein KA795_01625 [Burkholderiaceae bacterium]|nr:hypothetical protein [Burkholderiaceae bacterium]
MLDNCLPPVWAKGLNEFSCRQFADSDCSEVVALRQKFRANTQDMEWLAALGSEGGWAVLSADFFRKKGNAERELIRKTGLSVFVLNKTWHSHPFWPRTAQLMHWWPRIVQQANTVNAGAVEVPWRTGQKFTQIRI